MADEVPTHDPTTQSNYKDIATVHVSFEWTVDFDNKYIHGSATHQLVAKADVSEVIFDTRALSTQWAKVNGKIAEIKLDPEDKVMGSALHVVLPLMHEGDTVSVQIAYKTTEKSPALLWLNKEQTEGKNFPFLFSQCQPIHARGVAPLQDTPSVKLTYDAKVTSVLPVLLSALRVSPPTKPRHGGKEIGKDAVTYEYKQPVAIPSYLLAIAAGDLDYRPFDEPVGKEWKTGVWSEPKILTDAHNEFYIDTPKFLAAAEDLAGPYRFGVYDLLVLPYSFPLGGMENPCISFITPTLIAGDRSLTDVVIHELSHSWFGNGVTHAHASHYWLNEGWTNYIERFLQQTIHDVGHRGLSYVIGYKGLIDALKGFESTPRYQRLVIPFKVGEDPDAAYSEVPYEKGANFLLLLERTLGGDREDANLIMRPYIRNYVDTFIGKSITTDQWKDHLYDYFKDQKEKLDTIQWDEWLYGEGTTLPVTLEYDLTLVNAAYDLARRWDASRDEDPGQAGFQPSDIECLDSNQRVIFLQRLETEYRPLPSGHLLYLNLLYGFGVTRNAEIRAGFYLLVLREPKSEIALASVQSVLDWLDGTETGHIQGRMKFCRPLFKAASEVDREKTVATYCGARTQFHPIARDLIEQDLKLEGC